MKLYAPKYYKEFACIADKCRHSCCIGWEIDIDENTAEKYSSLRGKYSKKIIESIDFEGIPHFRLCDNERCPHLDASGLCNIITELGEDYLCDICREHPRYYNDTALGKEVGLGMACDEACRLILGSDDYAELVEIGEIDGQNDSESFSADVITLRKLLFSILSDSSLSHTQKLRAIYSEFSLSPALLNDSESRAILDSLEYLDEEHRSLFSCYSSSVCESDESDDLVSKMLDRALAYFIFRHCSPSHDENEFRESLALCLFCERLFASAIKAKTMRDNSDHKALGSDELCEIARIISEEIEYSEDNTEAIRFEFSFVLS